MSVVFLKLGNVSIGEHDLIGDPALDFDLNIPANLILNKMAPEIFFICLGVDIAEEQRGSFSDGSKINGVVTQPGLSVYHLRKQWLALQQGARYVHQFAHSVVERLDPSVLRQHAYSL